MRYLYLLLLFLFMLPFAELSAQDNSEEESAEKGQELLIGAEFRPRTELFHGYKVPVLAEIYPGYKTKAELFTTQRTRFNLNYKSEKMNFGLSLQDVRKWGDYAQLVMPNGNTPATVHQAWGELNFTKSFSLKAGRMELAYDDHRILGNVGWAQQARSHDLALFKYEGDIKAHLGLAFHGGPFLGNDAYKAMQFLWVNGKVSDLEYSVLLLNNGQAERQLHFVNPGIGFDAVDEYNAYAQTLGTRLQYSTGPLSAAANVYYQTGKKPLNWVNAEELPAGSEPDDFGLSGEAHDGQKISALNIALEANYTVTDNLKAGLSYEYLSGNDFTDPDRTDENAFNPLYGTNHKFNGWMDYFYVGNHIGNVGLQDISLKLIYETGPFFVRFFPHYFMPAGAMNYTDADGNEQELSALGTEFDIWAGYHFIPKKASIQLGYSYMLATESMYALKYGGFAPAEEDRGSNYWAWIMLSITPQWSFQK